MLKTLWVAGWSLALLSPVSAQAGSSSTYVDVCDDGGCTRPATAGLNQPTSASWTSASGAMSAYGWGIAGNDWLRAQSVATLSASSQPVQRSFLGTQSNFTKVLTVTQDASANVNVWAQGFVQIVDSLDASQREAALIADRDAQAALTNGVAFGVTTTASLMLYIHDIDDPNDFQRLDLFGSIQYSGYAATNGDETQSSGVSVVNQYGVYKTFSNRPNELYAWEEAQNTGYHARNFFLPVTLFAGRTYDVTMELNCFVGSNSTYTSLAGISTTCDAGHSAYWNGLTNIISSPGFALTSDDGQDMVYSSVLSPQPLVPANVPEPASWAMLIIGLGGVGGAARRRRGMPQRLAA